MEISGVSNVGPDLMFIAASLGASTVGTFSLTNPDMADAITSAKLDCSESESTGWLTIIFLKTSSILSFVMAFFSSGLLFINSFLSILTKTGPKSSLNCKIGVDELKVNGPSVLSRLILTVPSSEMSSLTPEIIIFSGILPSTTILLMS